jgi:nitrite reductase (NADH) small subunit
MSEHVLGEVDDFDEGRGYQIDIDGIQIALFKTDGEFYAVSNRCPHKNAPLHTAGLPKFTERDGIEDGSQVSKVIDEQTDDPRRQPRGTVRCDDEGCIVTCPHHGLRFDLETGYNDVADMNIAAFETKVVDGELRLII